MKSIHSLALMASALIILCGASALGQTSTISTVAIGTASTAGGTANGVVMITPRIGTALNQPGSVGDNLAGLQYVAGQIPLNGAPASIAFFALTGATIPGGAANPATAFTSYGTLISPTAVTTYGDVASKLIPNSYSGLTFAAADLGFGSGNFYMIHHTPGTDYLAEIVPGTGTSSLIADLKPMSWSGPTAGGPASSGTTGYFGLAWATGILSAGAPYLDQSIYYLRTDSGTTPSHTKFGVMIPALTGASSDTLDLTTAVGSFGVGGYTTLAFSPTAIGSYGANQFYYLRQDTGVGGTGNTILGWLNPNLAAGTRTISDIANLGGVFTTLNFAADATGPSGAWGSGQFYVTGTLPSGAQSISFQAIPNHNVGDVFTITPTASSGLDIDVTVISGPATVQTTGVSGATPLSLRVFTITTTGPGIVTLKARQAGRTTPLPAYVANGLNQSFDVLGLPSVASANSAPATVGTAFTYNITATGSPTSYTASPLPAGLVLDATTGAITGTPTTTGTSIVSLTATNPTGTGIATTLTITVAAAGVAPVITSANSAPGTVGATFTYDITATGSPASYTASPLPADLVLDATTGAITGTPSLAGTSIVALTATNSSGTGTSTLTITVAPAGIAPIITSSSSAPGTVGIPFAAYVIAATGLPTSFTAAGLSAGLTLNSLTGAINGTPTTAGVSIVALTATNGVGTGTATLTITVAPASVAPIIISPTDAGGTVGTPFATYDIAASGLPTNYTATGLPAGLTLDPLTGAINGTPTTAGVSMVTITATNSAGTATTTLTVTVAGTPLSARLVNASVRGDVGSSNGVLIAGFVINGTGSEQVILRGIGPTLTSAFGLTGTLSAPQLTLFNPLLGQIATNSVWGGGAAFSAAFSAVGAFALPANSLDSALAESLDAGKYTIILNGMANASGIALAEVYDADADPDASNTRLVNVSGRGNVGSGGDILIAGFVVSGNTTETLLIRGIGPGLSIFNLTGLLAAPQLSLCDHTGVVIAANAGWGNNPMIGLSRVAATAQIATAAETTAVGAFALPVGSADCAMLVTLPPGVYTVQLSGLGSATGTGLVEVYEVGP